MQKMMTKELERKVSPLYGQDGKGNDAIVYAHYFSCWSNWDWYMTEYDRETGEAFGLVKGFETELGYFSIREFEDMNKARGFEIVERDIYWKPCTLGEVRSNGLL